MSHISKCNKSRIISLLRDHLHVFREIHIFHDILKIIIRSVQYNENTLTEVENTSVWKEEENRLILL